MPPIDLRRAVALEPRKQRAERIAASRFEQRIIAPRHAWALRAVYLARLEAQGIREFSPADCWLARTSS